MERLQEKRKKKGEKRKYCRKRKNRYKTKNIAHPTSSARMKSSATTANDLQHTLKGIQDEKQDKVLCALGKNMPL